MAALRLLQLTFGSLLPAWTGSLRRRREHQDQTPKRPRKAEPMYDEPQFHEPFGPLYERPANPDCPNCDCCTAVLCEQGRSNVWGCLLAHDTDPDLRKRLADCPCSNGPNSFNGELMPLVDACNRGEITEDSYRERVGELLAKYGITDKRPLSGSATAEEES